MKPTLILLPIVSLLVSPLSRAALIAYDGFDGSPTGFSSAFSGFDSSTSLGYTDAAGNILDTSTGSTNGTNFASTATLSSPVSSGTFWVSFIVSNTTGDGADPFRFDIWDTVVDNSSANGAGPMIQSQFSGDAVNMGVASKTNGTLFSGDILGGTDLTTDAVGGSGTQFYAVSINVDTGTVTGYRNPNLDNVSIHEATASYTNENAQSITYNALQYVFATNYRFDEVRVGDTFADVTPFTAIPEPSTFTLVGLAMMAVFYLKRKS